MADSNVETNIPVKRLPTSFDVQKKFPVGSIYTADTEDFDVAAKLGYGTWVLVAEVGADTGNSGHVGFMFKRTA